MEFRLLGPLEVIEDDRSLALGGGLQRSLFGALLLHANEVVSTDRFIDALWGQSPPLTATKSVQVYVSRLRKEGLGPVCRALVESPPPPTVLVRRGPRPGELTPSETVTRFGWSITAGAS
jgi:Transcriptional regulatory protein, C terminal